jgi:hypothetical protein
MIDDEIVAIVSEHYSTPGVDLLLLSHLGKTLADDQMWPAAGDKRTLYETVEGIGSLRLIRDDKAPAFIAVVPNGSEQMAQKKIADRHKRFFLRGLPRALLLAFTLPIPADKVVFVQLQPKVLYRIGEVAAAGEFPIDADLRMPVEGAGDVDAMSVEDIERLDTNIRAWGVRHEIEVSTLKRGAQRSAPQAEHPQIQKNSTGSALERLYAAQDPEVAKKMIVPIDIAILLGRAS